MKVFEMQLELIINKNLYEKNIIDERTYEEVNSKLLRKLHNKGDNNEF